MRSSFTSWDACRNIRRHETSRALECADYSIRRTEFLKSRSFQNFAPSPDKSAFRSTVCCCLFQGLATIAVLELGQNGTRYGNSARSKIISLGTYREWPDGKRAIRVCARRPRPGRGPLEARREVWLDT